MKWILVLCLTPVLTFFLSSNDDVKAGAFIFGLFIVLPITFLACYDFYQSNSGNTVFLKLFNSAFRFPLFIFGLLSTFMGICLVIWVFYNVFIGRLEEYTGPTMIFGIFSFGVAFPLIGFGVYLVRNAFKRVSSDQFDADGFDDDDDDFDEFSDVEQDPPPEQIGDGNAGKPLGAERSR